MSQHVMMKCGHSGHATMKVNGKDVPCCVICWPKPEAAIVDDNPPSLEGRIAKCAYGCSNQHPSSPDLAFFESLPDQPFDRYYCGCRGWD